MKYITVDRSQTCLQVLDYEELIPPDHPARVIWELSGRFDLKKFEEDCKSREGSAGRPCWPARLLVSVWVYGYSMGVASARALERMMGHEPGLRWLGADGVINYHSLAAFRVGHQEALDELFAQFLAMLETAGVVKLKTLLQDGTKVKAVAGAGSLHRRKTLEKRLREARRIVRKLDQQAAKDEAMDARQQAAQKRAAREAVERAEAALEKIQKLEEQKGKQKGPAEIRVSQSEPEARKMKHPDGSWAPSYNVQFTTEEQSRMVVSVELTDDRNDLQQLVGAIERVKARTGEVPERIIADNGYVSRKNVEEVTAQGVELIAPWKEDAAREAGICARHGIGKEFQASVFEVQRGGKSLQCPAGKTLVRIGEKVHHGELKTIYQAREADCRQCAHVRECCGKPGAPRRVERVKETAAMRRYLARMKRREVKKLYGKRSEIAEFPQLWAKGVKNWRRFSVRGIVKAKMEALWVSLAYNFTQWLRIRETVATA